jgi:hypothetical protein
MANQPDPQPAAAAKKKSEREQPRQQNLTKAFLDGLLRTRPHAQDLIWDSKQTGLHVLVSRGPKDKRQATVTFRVVYYLKSQPGKPHYLKLGRYPDKYSDVDQVRRLASKIRNAAADDDIDPKRPQVSDVFEDVARNFIELHAKKNRSGRETERILHTYVLPDWRYKKIADIKRSHVTHLLDLIEQKKLKRKGGLVGGVVTADATLAALSKLFNWHAARSDDFRSPIVRGMRRAPPPKERARQRVLSDLELRVMWPILSAMGTYGAAVKMMLLTAQRARKVVNMRRSEIVDGVEDTQSRQRIDRVWNATHDDDPKNKQVSLVPLSTQAQAVIEAVPIIDAEVHPRHDYVFSLNGRQPLNGWSKAKARLDQRMQVSLRAQDPSNELAPWQLRDLRRTARTLMSRAGVTTEIAERALGHVMTLVRGTYDRFDYLGSKQAAFQELANLVERIINPPADNVVALRPGKKQKRRA